MASLREIRYNGTTYEIVGEELSMVIKETTIPITWEQGSIKLDTGKADDSVYRIHSGNFYRLGETTKRITVTAPSNLNYSTRIYSEGTDAGYISEESTNTWYSGTTDFDVQPGRYIKFVVRYRDGTAILPAAGEEVVATFESAAGDVSTIVSRNDPSKMEVKLQQLNRPTRIGNRELALAPFCLLHFSDIHGDRTCLRNIVDFKNHYSHYIDDVIHTGDSATDSYASDAMDFWKNTAGAGSILNVIGNHDTKVGSTWIGQTMAESYAAYFAPYVSSWGAVYTANKTYYYKDYTSKNVRLIVLDTMHQDSSQLSWFASTLSSANSAGLHVIAACHGRAHWQFDSMETPWDDKTLVSRYSSGFSDSSSSTYPENMSDAYASAVDTFINNGGHFICWIHGHQHHKMFATISTHPNQLDVSVGNAGGVDYAWTYVSERVQGPKSEDDFNVLAVDTYSNILRIAKVGVDYDRYMRHIDTISYDYANHELLYSN